MKKNKKLLIGLSIIFLIVAASLGLGKGAEEVEISTVSMGTIVQTVEETGYVQAKTSYNLQATQMAKIKKVLVEVGDNITEGQSLMELENLDLDVQITDVQTRISQAETLVDVAQTGIERSKLELNDAQENFKRVQELFNAGAVTKVEYDKAKLLVETWQKNLAEQKSQLADAQGQLRGLNKSLTQLNSKVQQLAIMSPVAGTVLISNLKQEQVVMPQELLFVVAVADKLEVKADILSDDLANVQRGQQVVITAPVLGNEQIKGSVEKIYPSAEEKTSALGVVQRRVPVVIAFDNIKNLKPGYEVRVAIETHKKEGILFVAREAVRTRADGQKEVMVLRDSKVYHQAVTTGIFDDDHIEIVLGLKDGDQVILDGSLKLEDGINVKPISKVKDK